MVANAIILAAQKAEAGGAQVRGQPEHLAARLCLKIK